MGLEFILFLVIGIISFALSTVFYKRLVKKNEKYAFAISCLIFFGIAALLVFGLFLVVILNFHR
jgi:drug/metabolite transporter (DMT)-like permease